jgi:hypothetical protein
VKTQKSPELDSLSVDSAVSSSSKVNTHSSISTSRRGFLKTAGAGVAALTAGAVLPTGLAPEAEAVEIGPPSQNPALRAAQSNQVRTTTSGNESTAIKNAFPHPTNGDEETYANQAFAGNFSKTLPHDSHTGLVDPNAYQALINALTQGSKDLLDHVPAGGPGKLAGPLSPLAFQLQGEDSTSAAELFVPPSISSAGAAAEQVELYWEAFVRDVPFIDYSSSQPLISQAIADINRLSAYTGPKPVTAQNIFRYGTGTAFPNANAWFGVTTGPYVSQILFQTHNFDGVTFVPKINTRFPVADKNTGQVLTGPGTGLDFMTDLNEYVFVENGNGPINPSEAQTTADPTPRFIRSGRDLGQQANQDSIYSIYFRAAIILAGLGIPFSANSPYAMDSRINGFNTFSTAWLFNLIGAAQDTEAQAFYQKWYVHRKLRPEAMGNLVDGIKNGRFSLNPSLHSDLLNSAVLPLINTRNQQLNTKRGRPNDEPNLYFLPQQSSGGSPNHPDPPAGHAFTAGVGVTLLKAVFDVGTPSNPLPWPSNIAPVVEASEDGLSLPTVPSTGVTVLGELNKLAFNIAEGRNWLGIHTRIGGNALGLTAGEDVAIALLNDLGFTYPEPVFNGFTLTKFDGNVVTVGAKQTVGTTNNNTATCA